MQPTAQTGIVWKISIITFILLAVVLYKINDYFKHEKMRLAQEQLRTQIISLKTSISSQISTLKNVLSSYEYELTESKINWVQLDPFFAIATAKQIGGKQSTQFRIKHFIGRSGAAGENWNAAFLDKILSYQPTQTDQPIAVQLFQDNAGAKYMSLRFLNNSGRAVIVVGGADYFQKYFDVSRGEAMTTLLKTSEQVLAAHSEADYLGSLMEDSAISEKRFIFEKEEIAGTNLTAINYISRKNVVSSFSVPWSFVGIIIGFGLLIIGVMIYTIDPLDRKIEKFKQIERDQVFKDTVKDALVKVPLPQAAEPLQKEGAEPMATPAAIPSATDIVKEKINEASEIKNFMKLDEPEIAKPKVELSPEEKMIEENIKQQLSGHRPAAPTSAVILDSADDFESLELVSEQQSNDTENLDLEKVLSLDDIEAEEPAGVPTPAIKTIQEHFTSSKININTDFVEIKKPNFSMKRKEFKVDEFEVKVRRPERT